MGHTLPSHHHQPTFRGEKPKNAALCQEQQQSPKHISSIFFKISLESARTYKILLNLEKFCKVPQMDFIYLILAENFQAIHKMSYYFLLGFWLFLKWLGHQVLKSFNQILNPNFQKYQTGIEEVRTLPCLAKIG